VFLYFLKNAAFYEFPGFAHMPMGTEQHVNENEYGALVV
jgi:hypothetical protein